MTATLPSCHEPAIQCAGVTLRRGGRDVLSDISFAIPAGSFVGLLGPNGAGKTTLLRAMLGLVPASQGQITLLGQAVRRGSAEIGYMPQTRGLQGAALSGRSLITAALDGEKWGFPWPGKASRHAVDAALAEVDATALADQPIGTLSGGERQRLLLAQTLLGSPRLLLLDEPLAGLDPVRMRDAAKQIRDIARARGLTVLFSAHDINPLLGVMDHVLYLAAGRAKLGTVEEVITMESLTALYGAPVVVARAEGRIFVAAESA